MHFRPERERETIMFESFIYFVIDKMYVCNINTHTGVINSTSLPQFKLWFTESEADAIEQLLVDSNIAFERIEDRESIQKIETAFNSKLMVLADVRKVYREYKRSGGDLSYDVAIRHRRHGIAI